MYCMHLEENQSTYALHVYLSSNVSVFHASFTEGTRQRAYSLVAQAYTSIAAEDFAAFVGYSVEEAVKGMIDVTWRIYKMFGLFLTSVFLQRCGEPGLAGRPRYQDGDAQKAR